MPFCIKFDLTMILHISMICRNMAIRWLICFWLFYCKSDIVQNIPVLELKCKCKWWFRSNVAYVRQNIFQIFRKQHRTLQIWIHCTWCLMIICVLIYQSHPIALSWGRDVGRLLVVQSLTYTLFLFLSCCMYHHIILDGDIPKSLQYRGSCQYLYKDTVSPA